MKDAGLDGRAAWIAAWAALATMTIAYGAPLIVVVGMKPIAAELGTPRCASPSVMFVGLTGMAAGGWGAGLLYDFFADYFPAFATGIGFNLLNLGVLLFLVQRRHGGSWKAAAA